MNVKVPSPKVVTIVCENCHAKLEIQKDDINFETVLNNPFFSKWFNSRKIYIHFPFISCSECGERTHINRWVFKNIPPFWVKKSKFSS